MEVKHKEYTSPTAIHKMMSETVDKIDPSLTSSDDDDIYVDADDDDDDIYDSF